MATERWHSFLDHAASLADRVMKDDRESQLARRLAAAVITVAETYPSGEEGDTPAMTSERSRPTSTESEREP